MPFVFVCLAYSPAASVEAVSPAYKPSSESIRSLSSYLNMNYFFGGRKPAVETIPGDRVRPLHFLENSVFIHGSNVSALAVFDEVLDPDVLREALENVVKRPGWERLGGRLKTNVSPPPLVSYHFPISDFPGLPWCETANRKAFSPEDDKRSPLRAYKSTFSNLLLRN